MIQLLIQDFNVLPTNYSGPTGITSVVGHDLRSNGIETSGLWAAVPHYLSSGAYPKGIGALMNKTSEILKIDIDDSGIQSEGQQFDTKLVKLWRTLKISLNMYQNLKRQK